MLKSWSWTALLLIKLNSMNNFLYIIINTKWRGSTVCWTPDNYSQRIFVWLKLEKKFANFPLRQRCNFNYLNKINFYNTLPEWNENFQASHICFIISMQNSIPGDNLKLPTLTFLFPVKIWKEPLILFLRRNYWPRGATQ